MKAAEKFKIVVTKDSQETRVALVEQSLNNFNETLCRIEKKFEKAEDKYDKEFVLLEAKIDNIAIKIDSNNKWLISLAISALFSAATLVFSFYSFIHKLS